MTHPLSSPLTVSSPVSRRSVIAAAVGVAVAAVGPRPVAADDREEAVELVEKARITFDGFARADQMKAFRDMLKKARGVYIAPAVIRGAFLVGASGGSGVLLVRDTPGKWAGPAFYTIGQASFGFQAGGDVSEVGLLAMTERGVTAMLNPTVKLGADASVAVGPVGAGVTGETAAISADIVSFSRAKGLYGGVSLDGAVVGVRKKLNSAYYGREVTPTDILINRTVSSPQSARLLAAVTAVSR